MKNKKSKKEQAAIIAATLYAEDANKNQLKIKIPRQILVHSSHIKQQNKMFFNLGRGFSKFNIR